jgi:hypothetical protein
MKTFLLSPLGFNCFIMTVYFCTSVRWAVERKWADMFYWLFALGITATVTFGYRR